jgi:hypothetical protein
MMLTRYVAFITNVLSGHLGWHRARLKFMARFTSALLRLPTTDLWKIALALKAGVRQKSNYRRIQRFFAEYDVDITALGGLLLDLLPQTPPYVVVIDRTEWHFGQTPVNVLTVRIGHDGMTIPVVWRALPSGGGSGKADHTDLLEQLLNVVDASSIEAVLADREFISSCWLYQMEQREIPFCIRLRSDRRIGESRRDLRSRHGCLLAYSARDQSGSWKGGAICSASRETDSSFLVLATRKVDPGEATGLSRRRWEIKSMFAVLTSRGFDLEATNLTDPRRVERLIGLLALAFSWTRLVEDRRARQEGPPPVKTHAQRAEPLPLRTGPAAEHPDHAGATTEGVLRMPMASLKSDCALVTYLGIHQRALVYKWNTLTSYP